MSSCIRLNIEYIQIVNACDQNKFKEFILRIMVIPGAFTKKRYIWNIIRGKDFYKNLSRMVVDSANAILSGNGSCTDQNIDQIIRIVLDTEKNEEVKKNFIWNITKHAPILTVDTIRYMSTERITNIIRSNKAAITDPPVDAFVHEIAVLRGEITEVNGLVDNTIQYFIN